MKWVVFFSLVGLSTYLYAVGQLEDEPTPLVKVVGVAKAESLGISKLTLEEQSRWLAFLRVIGGSSTLDTSVKSYMRNQGWTEVLYKGDVTKDGKTYAIFSYGLISTSYAVEKPFTLTLVPGEYFAKPKLVLGGLEAIIDHRGREHQFLFDEWIRLPR